MTQSDMLGQRPLPVSVGLLSRRSIVGAVVVLSIALFYAVAMPAINSSVKGEGDFTVGEPYVIGGTVQVTPADGWALDPGSNELFTTFTKSGASLVLVGAVEDERTLEEIAQVAVDGIKADTQNTWVIGDPQTIVTNVGDHGISVTAHTTADANESFSIRHGDYVATAIATSPEGVWVAVSPEIEAMVLSIVIIAGGDA